MQGTLSFFCFISVCIIIVERFAKIFLCKKCSPPRTSHAAFLGFLKLSLEIIYFQNYFIRCLKLYVLTLLETANFLGYVKESYEPKILKKRRKYIKCYWKRNWGKLRVERWYGKKVRSKHNVVLFLFCCFFFYFFLFHMCLFFLNSAVKNLINSFTVLKINTKTPVASCFRDIGNFVSI